MAKDEPRHNPPLADPRAIDARRAAMDGTGEADRPLRRALVKVLGPPWRIGYEIGRVLVSPLMPRIGRLHQHPPRSPRLPSPPVPSLVDDATLPAITLVTPSFQQGPFIARTIDSVLGQDYPALEYRVRDGGSSDETVGILEGVRADGFSFVSAPDQGQSHAINLGFADSHGEIMAWLNSDDCLLPGALHVVGAFFRDNPQVDVVYGNRILVDEQDREIGRWVLPPHDDEVLSWADFVPQETLFWRRRLWQRVGGYVDESFRFAMDWELLLRFRDAGARMERIPRCLGAFRVHPAQKTSAEIEQDGWREMDRLKRRVHGRDVNLRQVKRAVWPYLARHVAWHYRDRVHALAARWSAS